ncbi:MAG: hypothetical protein R2769_04295 [Saprospiraceae bacterium]
MTTKIQRLFESGQCLYITGAYEPKWGSSDEFQFKVKEVSLLASVSENVAQSVTLKVAVEALSKDLISNIDEVCKKYKGKHQLKLILLDHTNRNSLSFTSKRGRSESIMT